MKQDQNYARDDPRCEFPGKISVMFAGFPKNTTMLEAQAYFEKICRTHKYTIVKKKKKTFRGYGFIHVDTSKQAEEYTSEAYVLNGSQINVKIIKSKDDHIKESVFELIEPKKVFLKQIPKTIEKEQLNKIFSKFGTVQQILINKQPNETYFNSFIKFRTYSEAKKCVESKKIQINNELIVEILWARPNLSCLMINKFEENFKEHIKQVANGTQEYYPENFQYLKNLILNDGSIALDKLYISDSDQQQDDETSNMCPYNMRKDSPPLPNQPSKNNQPNVCPFLQKEFSDKSFSYSNYDISYNEPKDYMYDSNTQMQEYCPHKIDYNVTSNPYNNYGQVNYNTDQQYTYPMTSGESNVNYQDQYGFPNNYSGNYDYQSYNVDQQNNCPYASKQNYEYTQGSPTQYSNQEKQSHAQYSNQEYNYDQYYQPQNAHQLYGEQSYYTEKYPTESTNTQYYQNTVPEYNYDSMNQYGNSDFNQVSYQNEYQNEPENKTFEKYSPTVSSKSQKKDSINI